MHYEVDSLTDAQQFRMSNMCPVARDTYTGTAAHGYALPHILAGIQSIAHTCVNKEGYVTEEITDLASLGTAFNELLDSMKEVYIMVPDDNLDYEAPEEILQVLTDAEVEKINRMCPVVSEMRIGTGTKAVQQLLNSCYAKIAENQATSTASSVAGFVTDFNALLAKLKAAGWMDTTAEHSVTTLPVLSAGQTQKLNDMCPVGRDVRIGDKLRQIQQYTNIASGKVAKLQADSTATLIAEAIADFKSLVKKLIEAGLVADNYSGKVDAPVITLSKANPDNREVGVKFTITELGNVTYYYTLDGTTPTKSSTKYTGEVTLTAPDSDDEATITIKVIGTHTWGDDSDITTKVVTYAAKVI